MDIEGNNKNGIITVKEVFKKVEGDIVIVKAVGSNNVLVEALEGSSKNEEIEKGLINNVYNKKSNTWRKYNK